MKGSQVQVQAVRPRAEAILVDQVVLGTLVRQLGAPVAEAVVCRAMEDLCTRLGTMEHQCRAQDWDGLHASSRRVASVALQVGLRDVARVAGDVRLCIERSDRNALAATAMRLQRLGDASFTAMLDHVDRIV